MRVHIIFDFFLVKDGSRKSIGGVETYITNLSRVILNMGHAVSVYQVADHAFEKEVDGVQVYGVPIKKERTKGKLLLARCKEHFDYDRDLLIFGSDNVTLPAPGMRSITIQHGIFWDIPRRTCTNNLVYFAKFLIQCKEAWEHIKQVDNSALLVCVDHNFVNWYRAATPFPKIKMKVIPNFTEIAEPITKPTQADPAEPVRIIFARRFWHYRGTRIFAEAAKQLLEKYPNIEITLAGDGPDEQMLKENLAGYKNVRFITYQSHESLEIHADKDIAVVPTMASEGTSLSLLEAMSAQCAVVCTNVGGMTGIVIDGYNGRMISPDAEELFAALSQLVEDAQLRKQLADKAYETVKQGFSLARWQTAWEDVIRSMEAR